MNGIIISKLRTPLIEDTKPRHMRVGVSPKEDLSNFEDFQSSKYWQYDAAIATTR